MHHVYHTDALVLKNMKRGEAHSAVTLLTQELGLVYAFARSTRTSRSKLRFGLQEFTKLKVSLVRGREYWRVTGVADIENVYFLVSDDPLKTQFLARLSRLVLRLVQGEEQHEQFFDIVKAAFDVLPVIDSENVEHIECLTVLRMLHTLGYIDAGNELQQVVDTTSFSSNQLLHITSIRKEAITCINEALIASHL